MVAISQYPHLLFKEVITEPEQDASGNWLPVSSSWVLHSDCREEVNGRGASGGGSYIQGADGKALVFSSLVLLPRGTAKIPEETKVRVIDEDGNVRIEKKILKCDITQLHGRIWL